jgi:3-phosphoshikimate 1-carboxyvinyltransferase
MIYIGNVCLKESVGNYGAFYLHIGGKKKMSEKVLQYDKPSLQGTLTIPGDKSVSHRSVMFGAIAKGKTTVDGFLLGEDCLSTIDCFRKLGVKIDVEGTNVSIDSPGIDGWQEPSEVLYTGNSGTTTRLMLGILAGSNVHTVMTGDASIGKRPMRRVIDPLRQMGAHITGRANGQYTPLAIQGTTLQAIDYRMPVASAQVKSAILLAGLRAEGTTIVRETEISRDHTERMLRQFGATVDEVDGVISIQGGQSLTGTHVSVPGDISSAAFFLVAGAICEDSKIMLKNVGINPTRDGIIEVLQNMGAAMTLMPNEDSQSEPTATITIETSALKGTTIEGDIIPRLIDEIPILALLATQAHGKTIIKDAEELKVKETDRITAVVDELKKLGANIEATEDGMIIEGPTLLQGASLKTYGDHRIGMMGAVAALITDGAVTLDDAECIAVSYPPFFEHIEVVK